MDKLESKVRQNVEPLEIKVESNKNGTDGSAGRLPPFAISENDRDEDAIPHIDDVDGHGEFLDNEKHDEEPELHYRAGGAPFPIAPGFDVNSTVNTIPGSPESIPDVNIYQNKKTIAQGMIDVALFSANANQLRYVLESSNHPCYYPGIVLISISLLFQVAVGVGLLWNTRYDVKDEKEICIANKVNNFTIIGIFIVTVINVFISAFGTTAGATAAPVT